MQAIKQYCGKTLSVPQERFLLSKVDNRNYVKNKLWTGMRSKQEVRKAKSLETDLSEERSQIVYMDETSFLRYESKGPIANEAKEIGL